MKIIIVYGGGGLANDPSLAAVDRISTVLSELDIEVEKLELYKGAYDIQDFISSMSTSDGIVLVTTVEWMGIGGLMQTFLDECWNCGDKTAIKDKYLLSVVLSKQFGEREAQTYLIKSWEMLGGLEGVNICGHIPNATQLETDTRIAAILDKKTEDFYRTINQKRDVLPSSYNNRHNIVGGTSISEQLNLDQNIKQEEIVDVDSDSSISNYDVYIERQQKDIEELTNLFKHKLTTNDYDLVDRVDRFKDTYIGESKNLTCNYQIYINENEEENIVIKIRNGILDCYLGTIPNADVRINVDGPNLDKILEGKASAQRSFMTGELRAKGNFGLLYEFDELFGLRIV